MQGAAANEWNFNESSDPRPNTCEELLTSTTYILEQSHMNVVIKVVEHALILTRINLSGQQRVDKNKPMNS